MQVKFLEIIYQSSNKYQIKYHLYATRCNLFVSTNEAIAHVLHECINDSSFSINFTTLPEINQFPLRNQYHFAV